MKKLIGRGLVALCLFTCVSVDLAYADDQQEKVASWRETRTLESRREMMRKNAYLGEWRESHHVVDFTLSFVTNGLGVPRPAPFLPSLQHELLMTSRESPMPPGWRQNEQGSWVRETIHQMGRRCWNWDYRGTGSYLITIVLNDRRSAALGQVIGPEGSMALSPLGEVVERECRRIGEFTPEIGVLGVCVMPDHLHLVLQVKRSMRKSPGERL